MSIRKIPIAVGKFCISLVESIKSQHPGKSKVTKKM